MKIIASILAALFLIMGLLFVVAAFHPDARASGLTAGRLLIGGILFAAGALMIYLAALRPIIQRTEVHQTFEAPGELHLQKMKCDQCGGQLTSKDMQLISGAAIVHCPYCGASYQLEEEPKW